jgi:hypothetical protein
MNTVMKSTQEQRRDDVTQMIASWRIEGFDPDAEFLAWLDSYVAGTLTLEEIDELNNASLAARASAAA